MKVAVLTANLGNFDTNDEALLPQEMPKGVTEIAFHRFTDKDFPPIADLPPRFQYRLPKMFGYEMFPGYDAYIWLDGGMMLQRADSVDWFLNQLSSADMAFFKHPWRNSIQEEVEHIEQKLQEGNKYIVPRYKGGLHRQQLDYVYQNLDRWASFVDDKLYASTVFIYKNNQSARDALKQWWFFQSRYYTCDQVNLPYALWVSAVDVNQIKEPLFKNKYVAIVSHHK